MTSDLALGIDPDTTTPAFALLQSRGPHRPPNVLWAGIAWPQDPKAPVEQRIVSLAREIGLISNRYFHFVDVAVVESQRKYPQDKVDANDLIHLGQVAGICMAAANGAVTAPPERGKLLAPYPAQWKGNADKKIMQARYLKRVGFDSVDEFLKGEFPGRETIVRKGLASHVIDAIGLAWWGFEQVAPQSIPQVRRYGSAA